MIEMYEKLGSEARQALFGALNDAVANGESEVGTFYLAASLVRTPSVRAVLERDRVSLAHILAALKAMPMGAGGYDVLQKLRRNAEESATSSELQSDTDRLAIADGLVALKLSREAAAAWQELATDISHAHAESLEPLMILHALLKHDPALRDAFNKSGASTNTLAS